MPIDFSQLFNLGGAGMQDNPFLRSLLMAQRIRDNPQAIAQQVAPIAPPPQQKPTTASQPQQALGAAMAPTAQQQGTIASAGGGGLAQNLGLIGQGLQAMQPAQQQLSPPNAVAPQGATPAAALDPSIQQLLLAQLLGQAQQGGGGVAPLSLGQLIRG